MKKTEKEAQLSVYFDQCFKSLINHEWDTKKIDKAINDINKCNDKIKRYKSGKFDLSIMGDKEYIKKLVTSCLWAGALGGLSGLVLGPIGIPVACYIGMVAGGRMAKDKNGMYYPKIILLDIEKENNKALEWLKKEKERIKNGTAEKKNLGKILTGKQESSIFESIELI